MTALVRCLSCNEILEVSVEGEKDVCGCDNETTVIYDLEVIKISGNDLQKVAVFRESSQSFQAPAL
jgi:hypothetical protein